MQEIQNEINYYNNLECEFTGFIDVPALNDGEIFLVCYKKTPANPEKNFVPAYRFHVCKGGEVIGEIDLRIGYTDGLYYGGQVGYAIDEKHRGNGYAGKACRLLAPVAKAHKMSKLIITNDHTNAPSMRVCEKIGAKFLRKAKLPEWHNMYKEGQRFVNVYEWDLGKV